MARREHRGRRRRPLGLQRARHRGRGRPRGPAGPRARGGPRRPQGLQRARRLQVRARLGRPCGGRVGRRPRARHGPRRDQPQPRRRRAARGLLRRRGSRRRRRLRRRAGRGPLGRRRRRQRGPHGRASLARLPLGRRVRRNGLFAVERPRPVGRRGRLHGRRRRAPTSSRARATRAARCPSSRPASGGRRPPRAEARRPPSPARRPRPPRLPAPSSSPARPGRSPIPRPRSSSSAPPACPSATRAPAGRRRASTSRPRSPPRRPSPAAARGRRSRTARPGASCATRSSRPSSETCPRSFSRSRSTTPIRRSSSSRSPGRTERPRRSSPTGAVRGEAVREIFGLTAEPRSSRCPPSPARRSRERGGSRSPTRRRAAPGRLVRWALFVEPSIPEPEPDFPGATSFVATSAHRIGKLGAFYTTDVRLFNTDPFRTHDVRLRFSPAGGGAPRTLTVTLPPLSTRALEDAVHDTFRMDGYGPLFLSAPPAVVAASRTSTTAPRGGSFGLSIPAEAAASAAGSGRDARPRAVLQGRRLPRERRRDGGLRPARPRSKSPCATPPARCAR